MPQRVTRRLVGGIPQTPSMAEKITYSDVELWNQINPQLFELERQRQLEAERQ